MTQILGLKLLDPIFVACTICTPVVENFGSRCCRKVGYCERLGSGSSVGSVGGRVR